MGDAADEVLDRMEEQEQLRLIMAEACLRRDLWVKQDGPKPPRKPCKWVVDNGVGADYRCLVCGQECSE